MGKTIKVDLTGVESFQRCSEGVHTVKIATAEVKQSQGGNDMIVVSFEVTKGADKGSRVYENFPLVDTALWKLKSLLQAINMRADGKVSLDLDKLIGKVCSINVIHEEYEGKLRARVESIMKFAAEATDDEDEDEAEADVEEDEDEEEEKPVKKSSKEKATKKEAMNPPEESDDDEDDDWDDEDDEEEEEKPAPKKDKKAKKEEKPAKKAEKKSKKSDDDEDDDDWDDDDWDE